MNSSIESVTIPARVIVIGTEAFCDCKNLKNIKFVPGSRLKIIGRSFSGSGLEEITIPNNVVTIYRDAFRDCEDLRKFSFENRSKLENLGRRCFANSGLREIALPKAL